MNEIQHGTIVEILPTSIWIEDDVFGTHYVMVQHDGEPAPFEYCALRYNWLYTSNAGIDAMAEQIARWIGADGEIEHRFRMPDMREGSIAREAGGDEGSTAKPQEPGRDSGAPKPDASGEPHA